MRVVIVIIVLMVAALGVSQIVKVYQRSQPDTPTKGATSAPVDPLPPLPDALQASYQTALAGGAPTLKEWLATYGARVADPRKGDIELEYARLLARNDPGGARRVYLAVKERTPPDSPLIPRIRQLSRLFE